MDHNAHHTRDDHFIDEQCSLIHQKLFTRGSGPKLTMKLVSLSSRTFRLRRTFVVQLCTFFHTALDRRGPSVNYKLIPFFKKSHFRNQYHAAVTENRATRRHHFELSSLSDNFRPCFGLPNNLSPKDTNGNLASRDRTKSSLKRLF